MRAFLVTLAVVGTALGSAATDSLFVASTTNPANSLATGTSLWFGATGTGAVVCTGQNMTLACAFRTVTRPGRQPASFTLRTKTAAVSYTVAVLDSSGPAPLSSIASATFASSRRPSATIPAGATDTVDIVVRIRRNTPRGTYIGWILLTDVPGALSVGIPLSVTYA